MKNKLTLIIFLFGIHFLNAQKKRTGIYTQPNNQIIVDKDNKKPKYTIRSKNKFGSYQIGKGKKKIEFTFNLIDNENLQEFKTVKKPKKTIEINENCTKDFYESSGTVTSWEINNSVGNSTIKNIVPGAIYDLSTFNGSFFNPVETYKRRLIWIEINPGAQATIQNVKIQNPKFIGVIRSEGVTPFQNNLKEENYGANLYLDYSFERIYSEQHLNVFLGGSVPYVGGVVSFNTEHNSENSSDNYVYILELEEEYYTLNTTGNNVVKASFFKNPDINTDNFAYVESVTYGRKIIVKIESAEDIFSSDTNIEISNKGVFDGTTKNSFKNKSTSQKISYSISLQGGSTTNNINLTNSSGDMDMLLHDLSTIISTGNSNVKDGVPIRFTLKSFDHKTVTTDYSPIQSEIEKCNAKFKVSLSSIDVVQEGEIGKKLELFGAYRVKAYKTLGGDQFYTDEATTLINKLPTNATSLLKIYKNTSGKTEFATKDTPIKVKKRESFYINETSKEAGNHIFYIPNDTDNGYFIITIDAWDKDGGVNKDDEIDGLSQKIYFTDIQGEKYVTVKATGKKNIVKFTFTIQKVN